MSRPTTSAAEQKISYQARSDWKGGCRLVVHLFLLLVAGFALHASFNTWFVIPVMTAYGIVLVALFAPLHETVHRTAFRSRALNDIVAAVIGFLHFLPAGHFRRFHGAHHRYTQDPKRDPELSTPKPSSTADYLWLLSTIPYWLSRARELSDHARGRVDAAYIPKQMKAAIVVEARWHVAGWSLIAAISIASAWPAPVYYWLLPTLLGQPLLRFYLLAEHTGCEMAPDVHRNTRTVPSNFLVRYLMWNMPYHVEHHAVPAAPFHALPSLHRKYVKRKSVLETGYLAFHREYWGRLTAIAVAKRLR